MAGYVDDLYSRDDGFIAEAPISKSGEKLWDSLSFTYRVATRTEIIRHDAEVRKAAANEENDPECAVKAELLACDFVAKRVSKWDLRNRGNHDVAISADACSRMHGGLFGPLYQIIRGSRCSDPKPPATEAPPSDEAQQKN